MTSTARFTAVLLLFVAITAAGLFSIAGIRKDHSSELEARHRAHLAARESAWSSEAVERRQADQREDQDRLVKHHQELIQAFGGPVAAAAKNPQVDIAGMLSDVCQQCTGVAGAARVSVDRFTEFSVSINADRLAEDASLDEIVLCVFKHCAFYIDQIQIHRRGRVVKMLDRRAIELVHDWSQASVETVRASLEEIESEIEVVNNRQNSPGMVFDGEEGNLTVRASRWKKALFKLDEAANKSIQNINRAVQYQRQSLLAQRARTSGSFAAAEIQLAESQKMLKEARAFFSAPVEHYRRMLLDAGVDRLYIDAELRSFHSMEDPIQASLALELISNAENRGELTGRLLRVLAEDRGNWAFDAASGQIGFDSERTAEAFRTLSGQIETESTNLESAMRRWNETVRK